MIPLELSIRGFFSYKEEQVVDFRRLYPAGFFGFLGPTGAGKSALLEAILIALYADSARVSRSPTSVKNIESKEAKIALTFQILEEKYRATYEVLPTGGVRHQLSLIHPSGQEEVIASGSAAVAAKVQALVGLSYEQFTLAFLLQQGEFMKFLLMTGSERRDTLKSLFHVEQYDLLQPTSRLLDKVKVHIEHIEHRRAQLETIAHPEQEQQKRKVLAEVVEQIKASQAELQTVQEELKAIAQKIGLYKDWQKKVERYQKLKEEVPRQEARKEQLLRVRNLIENMLTLWREEDRLREEMEGRKSELIKLEHSFQELSLEHKNLQKEVASLAQEYDKRADLEAQKKAWEKVQAYQERQKDYQKKSLITQELKKKESDLISQREEEKNKLEEAMKELDSLEKELSNWPDELFMWYIRRDNLAQELQTLERELKQVEGRLSEEKERAYTQLRGMWMHIETLRNSLLEAALREILARIPPLPSREADASEWERVREAVLDHLRDAYRWVDLAGYASRLAETLVEGQPCPVCGSLHHPQKAQPDPHFASWREQLEKLGKAIKTISFEALRQAESTYKETLSRYQRKEAEKNSHEEAFRWRDLGHAPDQPTSQKQRKKQTLENQRKALQQKIATLSQNLQRISDALMELQNQKQALEAQLSQMQAEINLLRAAIVDCLSPEVLNYSAQEIATRKQHLLERLEAISAFPDKKARLEAIQMEMASYEGQIKQVRAAWGDTTQKLAAVIQQQGEQLQRLGFTSEEAQQYRNMSLDSVLAELEEVQQFFAELARLSQEVSQGKQVFGDEDVEATYQEKGETLKRLTQQLEDLQQKKGQLQADLERIQEAQAELARLQEELTQLKQRSYYLEELKRLFREGKFVQFVLQSRFARLVEEANKYFSRWTQGRLTLVAREQKLDLQVMDALAGGVRPVRSLSGGQTFQASLALALALSDQVLAQYGSSRQGVFFIDEGFGSLDEDSLHAVAQVLRELTREGYRAIGIVTHREELKELLGAYVEVKLEGEKGSKLQYA